MVESTAEEAALARKRRIAMRTQQRSSIVGTGGAAISEDDMVAPSLVPSDRETSNKRPRIEIVDDNDEDGGYDYNDDNDGDEDDTSDGASSSTTSTTAKKPHITGIKKQSRYDPGVPMNRDQLKAWRKEARRVRNRESAAASRQRNRERISELEVEVDDIKTRYTAALKLIISLEDHRKRMLCDVNNDSFTPAILRQDLMNLKQEQDGSQYNNSNTDADVVRPYSPVFVSDGAETTTTTSSSISSSGSPVQTVSPPLSPTNPPIMVSTGLEEENLLLHHHHHHRYSTTTTTSHDVNQDHHQHQHDYQDHHRHHQDVVNNKYQHDHYNILPAAKIPGVDTTTVVVENNESLSTTVSEADAEVVIMMNTTTTTTTKESSNSNDYNNDMTTTMMMMPTVDHPPSHSSPVSSMTMQDRPSSTMMVAASPSLGNAGEHAAVTANGLMGYDVSHTTHNSDAPNFGTGLTHQQREQQQQQLLIVDDNNNNNPFVDETEELEYFLLGAFDDSMMLDPVDALIVMDPPEQHLTL